MSKKDVEATENAEKIEDTVKVGNASKVDNTAKKDKKSKKSDKPKFFARIGKKIKEIISELKKVNWPTFSKVVKQTSVVLGVVLIFLIVITLFDFGLTELLLFLGRDLKDDVTSTSGLRLVETLQFLGKSV